MLQRSKRMSSLALIRPALRPVAGDSSLARSLTAVSFRPYRGHQLEMRDGREGCQVIIHPPGGRGSPHRISPAQPGATLADQINQAKAMIDAVMGPKPVMARPAYRRAPM
jgi:hypothetical protein